MRILKIMAGLCVLGAATAMAAGTDEDSRKKKNETAAVESTRLDEVVVNAAGDRDGYVATTAQGATKTSTPLIETPQAVSVITRDQMDERAVDTIGQILRYTPGVAAETQGADHRNDSSTYIRGFSADRYLDNLKMLSGAFTFATVDPYFLQSAEVLYGPNSILYGNASPGGVLNLVSKTPQATPFNEARLRIGSEDLYEGAFDSTGPLDKEGHFLYRITGIGRTAGTQINDSNGYKRLDLAPAITWKPDSDTTLTVIVNVINDPEGGSFNALPARGTLLTNPNGQIPRGFNAEDPNYTDFDRQQYSASYQFEKKVNEVLAVRQNFRYVDQQLDYKDIYPTGLAGNNLTITRDAFHVSENLNAVCLDNQMEAKFDTGALKHDVLCGLDYQNNVYAESYRESTGPSINYLSPVYLPPQVNFPFVSGGYAMPKQSIDQIGLYAQEQLKWNRWVLDFGVRKDWYANTTVDRLLGGKTYTVSEATTMRTGILYASELGLSPYFNYAQSFQPVTGTDRLGNVFIPTRGEQEEVGLKYQPKSVNAFATLAFYTLDQSNVVSSDPNNPLFRSQTGKVRSQGTEFQVNAAPAKGLNLTAGYSYVDNLVVQATGSTANTVGKHPIALPEHRIVFWEDYTFQDGWLQGFGLGSGVRWNGQAFANTTNTVTVPDYTLIDLGVHYDFGPSFPGLKGLRAAVNVSNLFDRTYFAAASGVNAATNAGSVWYGEGRTVQGTLTYRW